MQCSGDPILSGYFLEYISRIYDDVLSSILCIYKENILNKFCKILIMYFKTKNGLSVQRHTNFKTKYKILVSVFVLG